MEKITAEDYSKMCGVSLESIASVSQPEKLIIDENVHRSMVHLITVSFTDGTSKRLLRKQVNPEYSGADFYEAAILESSYELSSKISPLHYFTPRLLHHDPKEHIFTMDYVEGDNLGKYLDSLDERINFIERVLRSNHHSKAEISILQKKYDLSNELKKTFVKLALLGLAEFQHFSKEHIGYISDKIKEKKRKLKLYDPLKDESENHYRDKILKNLSELLDYCKVKYNAKDLTESLLSQNSTGKLPLRPILDEIADYNPNSVIVYDYYPLHIIPKHSPDVLKMVKEVSDVNLIENVSPLEFDILKKKIEEEGKVCITDLGDVRIGHDLSDFIDLSRNHALDFKDTAIIDLLGYFTIQKNSLEETATTLELQSQKKFLLIDSYRALRAAVKSEKEWQKAIYLDHFLDNLKKHEELGPLNEIIREKIILAANILHGIAEEKNHIRNSTKKGLAQASLKML